MTARRVRQIDRRSFTPPKDECDASPVQEPKNSRMIERGLVLAIADDVVEIPYLAHEIRKQRQFDVMNGLYSSLDENWGSRHRR